MLQFCFVLCPGAAFASPRSKQDKAGNAARQEFLKVTEKWILKVDKHDCSDLDTEILGKTLSLLVSNGF